MCGHVGIAGNLEHKDEGLMQRLLMFDYFRGKDSTGISVMGKNGDIKTAKIASHPIDLFDTKKFNEILKGCSSQVFLGHNRAATKGVVNGVNAHPFTFDHITGAHNGTLDTKSWHALEDAIGEKFDVDSQALICAIARLGIEDTVKLLQGAWALVWIDSSDGTLNFLRNKERTFWYAYSEDFKKIIWASENPIMEAALRLAPNHQEVKLWKNENNCSYFGTQIDVHYQWKIDDLKKGGTERPKPKVKEMKGKEPAPASNYSCGHTNFPSPRGTGNVTPISSQFSETTNSHGRTTTQTSSKDGDMGLSSRTHIPDVIHFVGSDKNPFGGYISQGEFERMSTYGCAWCQTTDMDYHDKGLTVFKEIDQVMCSSCSGRDETRVYVNALAMSR